MDKKTEKQQATRKLYPTNVFDKLLDAADNAGQPVNSEKTRKWFIDNVKTILGNVTPGVVMKAPGKLQNMPGIGRLFMFYYNPKYKDELPYYDMFPCTLIIWQNKTHFMGLNFHYLPPRARAKLLGELMKITNNKYFDERTKIQATYGMLVSASKLKLFRPCLKKYLKNHVRSRFLKLDADEWEAAVALPVESFVKATKSKVWQDSVKGVM